VFEYNSGVLDGKGNDYYDFCDSNGPFEYYTQNTIANVVSRSLGVRFYYSHLNRELDCLFLDSVTDEVGCRLDNVYIDSALGVDIITCGQQQYPCKGFVFVSTSIMTSGATLHFVPGDYPIPSRTLTVGFTIKGVVSDADLADASKYPLIYPPDTASSYMFMTSNSYRFRFINLKFETIPGITLFRVYYHAYDILDIVNCIFTVKNSEMSYCIINNDYGSLYISDSRFYNISSNNASIIDYSWAMSPGYNVINNCTFVNVSNTGAQTVSPAVFGVSVSVSYVRSLFYFYLFLFFYTVISR
jgi:hypothetical protein